MIPEPEPEDSDDSDEESEGEHATFTRYMFSSISEVSDPEQWQNMHHHSFSDESSGEQGDQVPPASNTSGGQAPSQPAVLDARIPLRPNMVKCYAMLSAKLQTAEASDDGGSSSTRPWVCSLISIATGIFIV